MKEAGSSGKRLARRWSLEELESRITPSSLITDKLVYAPGESIALHLSGFQTGETVVLQVVRTDGDTGLAHPSLPWLATDGGPGDFDQTADGRLTVNYTIPEDVRLDSFQITAAGQSSGATARTTLWGDDSHRLEVEDDSSAPPATDTTLSSSALPSAPGQPVTLRRR